MADDPSPERCEPPFPRFWGCQPCVGVAVVDYGKDYEEWWVFAQNPCLR